MTYSIRNKKSGFTLIELLVVIAIIGVLATVVLASLNTARRKSRDARRITDLKQIQLALELYFDGVGASNYPTGTGGVCTAVAGATATENWGLGALVTGGYIATVPRDPSNTATCYLYRVATINANRSYYHLATVLEDSGNSALNSDRDCTDAADGAAPDCLAASPAPAWAGAPAIVGNNTAACTGAAGATDNCYDLTP